MEKEFYLDSLGAGKIRCKIWLPDGEPKGVVQLIHGIAEHIDRYDDFAHYLNKAGFVVTAEDHMGHGKSASQGGSIQGYFHGGWFTAVEDSYMLTKKTMADFPGVPYFLFGHSMGSFLTRTILCKHPDSDIRAAVICGTGWQPRAVLPMGIALCKAACASDGETKPAKALDKAVFGSYNKRVEHPRTSFDWLTRDASVVDAYIADPMCGFVASAGLLRDMMTGIAYIERPDSLAAMNKELPVFFIAGGDDPVGAYSKGVHKSVQAFRNAGVKDVKEKIYPLGRHEILNEINKKEVYEDVLNYFEQHI